MKFLLPAAAGCMMLSAFSCTSGGPAVPEDRVVGLPVASDPTISFRLWFRVGSQDDPPGKEGLAALTASMLTDASTQTHTYEQVLDLLYPLAAAYGATTSAEMTVVYGRTHRDNLDEYYPLFLDAVLRPGFKQEDLDRIRSQTLNYLENTLRYASDEELGKAVLYGDLFTGTGYGHIPQGTVEAVGRITLDDIRAFTAKYFTRDNVVIGIGGSYDGDLIDRLRRDLGALPAGERPAAGVPSGKKLDGFHVTIVEKEAQATAISMGFPVEVLRGSREWYALAIANSWLGEHRNSSSRLYQVIREERGLNYGDYSYIEHFPGGGTRTKPPQNVCRRRQIFEIWIRPVPNEARHFALRAGLREFRRLVENGLTREQFDLTRKFLRKYVRHYAPTTSERLGYALDDRFYGMDESHLELFPKTMEDITLEEVNAAVRKHWRFGRMQIAVVTKDAESLRDALVGDTPSPIAYSTPKPATVLAEDREIERFSVPVRRDDVRIVRVEDLFLR